jgi:hypothetical protein
MTRNKWTVSSLPPGILRRTLQGENNFATPLVRNGLNWDLYIRARAECTAGHHWPCAEYPLSAIPKLFMGAGKLKIWPPCRI